MSLKFQRDVFIDEIYEAALKDKDIFFISADFGAPSLDKFRENLPIIKHFIQMDLFKFVLGLEKITFTETYEKPDTKKETKQESKTKDNKK